MATMPIIDDDMVELFQRTGRPRSRPVRRPGAPGGNNAQVQPQAVKHCKPGDMVSCRDANGNVYYVQCPPSGSIDC